MRRIFIVLLLTAVTYSASFAQEAPRRYGIKSGILTQVTSINGIPAKAMFYFDDYGSTTADYQYQMVNRDGKEEPILFTARILKDGQMYSVSYIRKQKKATHKESELLNFNNLTNEVIKKNHIKKHRGQEEICGKMCDIYTTRTKYEGFDWVVKSWVWKGIILKKTISYIDMYQVIETTDFQENVPVDPEVFVVPDFEEIFDKAK